MDKSKVDAGLSAAKAWLKSKLSNPSNQFANFCQGTVDVKTPQRVHKWSKKLITFTQNKELNLKNSPPYLQGILIDTQDLIAKIFSNNPTDYLKDNKYLNVFVTKFILQCKKTVKLFKDAKEEMEIEQSQARRDLNRLTLVFSHNLAELKTLFKDGIWQSEFKIVKKEAREFWAQMFGKTIIMPWDQFLKAFAQAHKVCSPEEGLALKGTVDLTENDHVTWFEFDIFTRLFQPWEQLLNNWNVIAIMHPGYKAFMTYDEVEAVLQEFKNKPGSYVFRLSCTRLGQWAIGFVTPQHTIVQTIPQSKSLYQALIEGATERTYIYPCGQDRNPDIREQIRVAPEKHIQVSKEQYDLYCDIDTTFELCKICNNDMKSVRIDPCGHLLCKKCLTHWMESGGNRRGETTCPFCREKVLSTESIVIDPFNPFGDAGDSDDEPATPNNEEPSVERNTSWGLQANVAPAQRPRLLSQASEGEPPSHQHVKQLTDMGFKRAEVEKALRVARNDVAVATDILLQFSSD